APHIVYTLPYTTLFRSQHNFADLDKEPIPQAEEKYHAQLVKQREGTHRQRPVEIGTFSVDDFVVRRAVLDVKIGMRPVEQVATRSEEHTSELQSRENLV